MTISELIEELKKYPSDAECISINHQHIFENGEYCGPKGGWNNYWGDTVPRGMDGGQVFFGVKVTEEHFDKGV